MDNAKKEWKRTQLDIIHELYNALEKHGAPMELLCIVGSIGDTMENEELLGMLIDYNRGENTMTETHSRDDS